MPVLPFPGASRRAEMLASLTAREREILTLMAGGYSNAGIAGLLHLSEKTVESHVGRIFRKLDIGASTHFHRRVQAVLIHLEGEARRRTAA